MAGESRTARIAYQGMEGSFSETAAKLWAELERLDSFELLPGRNARGVAKAVQSGEADYGVVGVVNSTSGTIGETADTMEAVRHTVVGSLVLHVAIGLFALPDMKLEDVRTVVSHPASLYQCERTLKRVLPNVDLIAAPTSAIAAMRLASNELPAGSAVLCSPRAGLLRKLVPLLMPANDNGQNETAFMVFRRPPGRR